MRVLSVIPPMTQLNTPYPSTAYLTGFLRSRGIDAVQRDLAIELVHALMSRAGLEALAAEARAIPSRRRTPAVRSFLRNLSRHLAVIESAMEFLRGLDPTLAHRIASRSLLPEGPRFAALERFEPRYHHHLARRVLWRLGYAEGEPEEASERLRRDALAALDGRVPAEALERHLRVLPTSYLLSTQPEQIGMHIALIEQAAGGTALAHDRAGDVDRLTIVTRDRPGILSLVAGTLAVHNVTVLGGTAFTRDDGVAIDGRSVTRTRGWDSCFTPAFSHVHGKGPLRDTIGTRYRQWTLHKLSTWHDQFGASGCVGCGRCISWCPVGIDITAEVAALGAKP